MDRTYNISAKRGYPQKNITHFSSFFRRALLGGGFLHLISKSIEKTGTNISVFLWVLIGFSLFFLMEQLLQVKHPHRVSSDYKEPVSYLILIADGLHNFTGGLAIAGSFLISPAVGIITWIASAAHEIPQELGDFGILIHSGWKKHRALIFNLSLRLPSYLRVFSRISFPQKLTLHFYYRLQRVISFISQHLT